MTKVKEANATVEVEGYSFPQFDLARLMKTVFPLRKGERFGVFIDLPDPRQVEDFAYLEEEPLTSQEMGYIVLYRGLLHLQTELEHDGVSFYAYEETGGPNLDLPDTVFTPEGEELDLREAMSRHTIVLFTGRWSATAPVTALAKELGLRGATMHGLNPKVLATGLAVDYREVSARAERLRKRLTRADSVTFHYRVEDEPYELVLELDGQEAQKSHGLVHTTGDIANLPAGEVYWVPTGASGFMPQKFEDDAETLAIFRVENRGITALHKLIRGDAELVDSYLQTIAYDPNAGQLTELGLGTQSLPFAGCDIQDEKILGTAHVATGRSDHLGGDLDSSSFKDKRNASHNDILFAPHKTPEIVVERVTLTRDGETVTIIENYQPTDVLKPLL